MALVIKLSDETIEAVERLLNDAIAPAQGDNPLYTGRYKGDIEDDIEFVRAELDIEI